MAERRKASNAPAEVHPVLEQREEKTVKLETCGIVMPIGELDGCTQHHWQDVLDILSDAVDQAGYEANLVSNADEVSFINKRIVQNLYQNPIVVCDVSGKNPNVMFELGMRLAFDKPTIIVKDDKTNYSFDIAGVEHLPYPRDLRFSKIVDFKKNLVDKINATITAAKTDAQYTTFLKHFGEFKVPKLESKEVSGEEIILDELRAMRQSLALLSRSGRTSNRQTSGASKMRGDLCLGTKSRKEAEQMVSEILEHPDVIHVSVRELGHGHIHIQFDLSEPSPARVRNLESLFDSVYRLSQKK